MGSRTFGRRYASHKLSIHVMDYIGKPSYFKNFILAFFNYEFVIYEL